jgi:class 3 adenylate cyclase
MFDAISSNGGTLNQMVGDGIMAVFGAPVFHEDHRLRAVRAGLDMVENLEMFNVDRVARGKLEIKIGIGIATGRVIAGYTGTQHRATYTCVGDTVNLAARIAAHTKTVPYSILMTSTLGGFRQTPW